MDRVHDLLDCARYGEFEEILSLLHITPQQQEILKNKSVDIQMKFTEEKLPILTEAGSFGNTMIHMAAANDHQDILAFILARLPEPVAAHVNRKNEGGNTPLHWAALNGHAKVVEMLLAAGADPKITNDAGHTAVYEAQAFGKDDVVETLLRYTDFEEEEDGMEESDIEEKLDANGEEQM